VILGAPVLPMLLYLTISVCGYLTFGDAVPSNIINAYPGSPLVAACRLVLGCVVLCNFPLQMFAARASTVSLLGGCISSADDGEEPSGLFIRSAPGVRITVGFLVATALAAWTVTDLGMVVSIVGSTGATVVSLITPSACYLLLTRHDDEGRTSLCTAATLRMGAWVMGLLGASIMPSKLFC